MSQWRSGYIPYQPQCNTNNNNNNQTHIKAHSSSHYHLQSILATSHHTQRTMRLLLLLPLLRAANAASVPGAWTSTNLEGQREETMMMNEGQKGAVAERAAAGERRMKEMLMTSGSKEWQVRGLTRCTYTLPTPPPFQARANQTPSQSPTPRKTPPSGSSPSSTASPARKHPARSPPRPATPWPASTACPAATAQAPSRSRGATTPPRTAPS